ncbi:hypothetical protein EH2_02685 [Bacillus subtilis]|nr:hypothetical protein ABU16_2114 [Bacillus subtilis]RAP06520.1 hypothetical protein HS3_03213 [Bacillus subtilis]RPK17377.1 hypothetical protein EH2_02685 [Bacillus subtilis]
MEKGKNARYLLALPDTKISYPFLSREAEGLARRSFSNRCNGDQP